jgi:hypothetical protein
MKKAIFMMLLTGTLGYSQTNTTGTVNLGTSMTAKIDTDATNVTLTLTGPSTAWFGIGFGGLGMLTANDMFIWSSATDRDYTSSSTIKTTPSVDAGGATAQNWTIVSDTAPGAVRTVVATRPLASTGDYTFANNTSSIDIIYAFGTGTALGYHGDSTMMRRGRSTLTRTTLGVEDFSLNASTIFPVPSRNGIFTVQSKTGIDSIGIYTQTGAFVKTIQVNPSSNTEVTVEGLSQGVYLFKLENSTDKSWKKVVVN